MEQDNNETKLPQSEEKKAFFESISLKILGIAVLIITLLSILLLVISYLNNSALADSIWECEEKIIMLTFGAMIPVVGYETKTAISSNTQETH